MDMGQNRGEQLDEAVEKVGGTMEEKVGPTAEKIEDKVVDATGGMPDDPES
ncbi:MAG: hypothetical protein M3314_08645 [Actinomycetota bacterium]|nr:hypothetical protein [Actinomycetota bacterium]